MIRSRDLADEGHVVLDHEQRMFAPESVDDLGRLERFSLGHSRSRLVEQHDLGVLNHQHPKLEPLGLAMAEIGGDHSRLLGEADQFEHLGDAVLRLARKAESEIGETRVSLQLATSRLRLTVRSLNTLGI